jgi:hypothetical protein
LYCWQDTPRWELILRSCNKTSEIFRVIISVIKIYIYKKKAISVRKVAVNRTIILKNQSEKRIFSGGGYSEATAYIKKQPSGRCKMNPSQLDKSGLDLILRKASGAMI